MENLFICLLANLKNNGKIKSASIYDDELASITLVTDNGKYKVNIVKEIKLEEKES